MSEESVAELRKYNFLSEQGVELSNFSDDHVTSFRPNILIINGKPTKTTAAAAAVG